MPPKAGGVLRTARGEVLRVKSPAEFFSENKNIAGFDNPGKSLYTTIRELVENSLDACEAAGVLPDIEITLHEIDKPALDKLVLEAGTDAAERSWTTAKRFLRAISAHAANCIDRYAELEYERVGARELRPKVSEWRRHVV